MDSNCRSSSYYTKLTVGLIQLALIVLMSLNGYEIKMLNGYRRRVDNGQDPVHSGCQEYITALCQRWSYLVAAIVTQVLKLLFVGRALQGNHSTLFGLATLLDLVVASCYVKFMFIAYKEYPNYFNDLNDPYQTAFGVFFSVLSAIMTLKACLKVRQEFTS